MAYKLFLVPIDDAEAAEGELNSFLRSHTILDVDKRWIEKGSKSFLVFCVDYLEHGSKQPKGNRNPKQNKRTDYRALLNEADAKIFDELRLLRTALTQAEGLPVYAVCNNDQLYQMIVQRARTKKDLEKIMGVGDARLKKYGDQLADLLAKLQPPVEPGSEAVEPVAPAETVEGPRDEQGGRSV